MTLIIRNGYQRKRSDFNTVGKSSTKQSFKDECDINNILGKFRKTGLLEHVAVHQGDYRDLSEPTDYQTALNIVLSANAAFESLPSDIRKDFGNNPAAFLEFVDNPDNADKLVEMGLANPPENQLQALPDGDVSETPPAETPPA